MLTDALLADMVAEQRAQHAIHTAILYGSHARGDATAESDLDFATWSDTHAAAMPRRDARHWRGLVLDGFVYATASLVARPVDPDLLKLAGGRILADDRGLAGPLLAAIDAAYAAGPPAITADDAQMRRVWARKMLARIVRGDLEAHYRRHWLLVQLLEDYFALRGRWYLGPKQALAGLAPPDRAIFTAALAPDAPHAALAELVELVIAR